MAQFKYLKRKEKLGEKPLQQLVLPSIKNCVNALLLEKDLECDNII